MNYWYILDGDLFHDINGQNVYRVCMWISLPNGAYYGKIIGQDEQTMGGNPSILLGTNLESSALKLIKMANRIEQANNDNFPDIDDIRA